MGGFLGTADLESLEARQLLSTTVATFEGLGVPANSFVNNAGSAGAFVDAGNAFSNEYSSDFGGIWSGWALSTMTDTTTADYTNQYSAITGSGAGGSATYGVGFTFGATADPFHPAASFVNLPTGATPQSIQVTNTTYTYLTMRDGNLFTPKFGSGDFLLLTIDGFTGPNGTGTKVGEVDFYLANFQGTNASIVNTWQTVDLSPLAGAQSLQFGIESSQNDPTYGINTPAYFAADNLVETLPAPTSITISPADPSVASGLTQQFTATGTYEDGSTQDLTSEVTWSSDTTSVASIDANGLATGLAVGSSNITASLDGVTTSTKLNVTAPVLSSLDITPANPNLADGLTQQFTATGTYSDKSTKDLTSFVTWASSSPTIASIDATGLATGLAAGVSNITATLGGIGASTTLNVTAPVLSSLTITPTNPSIADGLTQQFTATGTYSDKSTKDLTGSVTWASASSAIASIDAAGLATGLAVGSSQITASLDGIDASTILNVTAPVLTSLAISPANPNVADGLTQQFTATGTYSDKSTKDLTGSVTWASAAVAIASIDASGLATGLAVGSSSISASLDGITASTTLNVTAPVLSSLAISPANPSVADGLTQQLTVTGTYSDQSTKDLTGSVTWASASPTIASIDATGLATGLAVGTSRITATFGDFNASTTLNVTAPVLSSLSISPANPSVAAGLTQPFTVVGTYSDKSTKDLTGSVTWASASPTVATIDAAGLATGLVVGTSDISASLDGVSTSRTLNVTAPVLTSLAISPANPSVADGLTRQLMATGTYSDQSTKDLTGSVTWASASSAVASINSSGLATGLAIGSSRIGASLGGVSASTTLNVTAPTLMSIVVTPVSASVAKGLTTQYVAVGTYSDKSTVVLTSKVAWTSANPSVASINASGVATGLATGTSAVTAKLDGVSGSASVTVTAATLLAITIKAPSSRIETGQNEQFTATGAYSDGSTQDLTNQVNWASSQPSVATITGSGLATGVSTGSSTVSAALNGTSATLSLNVTAPPTSPVTVTTMQVQQVVLGTRPFLRRTLALVVHFNGALSPTGAQNLAAYKVFSGRLARVHGVSQVVYDRPVPIRWAIYDPSNNKVTLVPRGNVSLPRLERLMVDVSIVTNPQGAPINNGANIDVKTWRRGLI